MRIETEIGGSRVEFTRDWFTGHVTLVVDGAATTLANPLNPATHVSLSLTRTYRVPINGRELVIEEAGPFPFPGLRPHDFRLLVDGEVLIERRGF